MKPQIRKIVLVLMAAFFAFSCSGDDSIDAPLPLINVPSVITVSQGADSFIYRFDYDGSRRVSKIVKTNGANSQTMLFSYNATDQITEVNSSGSSASTVHFDYQFGRLSHINSDEGFDEAVTYNPSDNGYYLFSPNLIFKFEDNADLSRATDTYFTYDLSKKGAFANVKSNLQFYGSIGDDFMIYFTPKLPLVYYGSATDPHYFALSTTYNAEGYLAQSTGNGFVIDYQYTKTY